MLMPMPSCSSAGNDQLAPKRNLSSLAIWAFTLTLCWVTSCNQGAEPIIAGSAYNPSTGLFTLKVDNASSYATILLQDQGQALISIQIPTQKGQFITDSTTLTGGALMLDVRHARMQGHTAPDTLTEQWMDAIRHNFSAKTDSGMIIRLNTVSPAPLKISISDSGKLADPTHLISAMLDRGDTSHIVNFGSKVLGMPKAVHLTTTFNCNAGIFGFKYVKPTTICQVTINIITVPVAKPSAKPQNRP